jgi:hypothetical protein
VASGLSPNGSINSTAARRAKQSHESHVDNPLGDCRKRDNSSHEMGERDVTAVV